MSNWKKAMMAAAGDEGVAPATKILHVGPFGAPSSYGSNHTYEFDINTVGSPQSGYDLSNVRSMYSVNNSYDVKDQSSIYDEVNDVIISTHTQRQRFVLVWHTNTDPTAWGPGAGHYVTTGTASWNRHLMDTHSGNPLYKAASTLYTCGTNNAYSSYVNRIYYHNYSSNSSSYTNKNTSGTTSGFVIDEDRGLMFHSVSPSSGADKLEIYTLNSTTGQPTFSSSSYTNAWGNAPSTSSNNITARGYDPKRQVLYVGVQNNASGSIINDYRYGSFWALDVSTPSSPVIIGEWAPSNANNENGNGSWFYDANTDRIVIAWYKNNGGSASYITCLDCSQVSTNGTVASMNYVGFFRQGSSTDTAKYHCSHFPGDSIVFFSTASNSLYYGNIASTASGAAPATTDTTNIGPSPDHSSFTGSGGNPLPLMIAAYTP